MILPNETTHPTNVLHGLISMFEKNEDKLGLSTIKTYSGKQKQQCVRKRSVIKAMTMNEDTPLNVHQYNIFDLLNASDSDGEAEILTKMKTYCSSENTKLASAAVDLGNRIVNELGVKKYRELQEYTIGMLEMSLGEVFDRNVRKMLKNVFDMENVARIDAFDYVGMGFSRMTTYSDPEHVQILGTQTYANNTIIYGIKSAPGIKISRDDSTQFHVKHVDNSLGLLKLLVERRVFKVELVYKQLRCFTRTLCFTQVFKKALNDIPPMFSINNSDRFKKFFDKFGYNIVTSACGGGSFEISILGVDDSNRCQVLRCVESTINAAANYSKKESTLIPVAGDLLTFADSSIRVLKVANICGGRPSLRSKFRQSLDKYNFSKWWASLSAEPIPLDSTLIKTPIFVYIKSSNPCKSKACYAAFNYFEQGSELATEVAEQILISFDNQRQNDDKHINCFIEWFKYQVKQKLTILTRPSSIPIILMSVIVFCGIQRSGLFSRRL